MNNAGAAGGNQGFEYAHTRATGAAGGETGQKPTPMPTPMPAARGADSTNIYCELIIPASPGELTKIKLRGLSKNGSRIELPSDVQNKEFSIYKGQFSGINADKTANEIIDAISGARETTGGKSTRKRRKQKKRGKTHRR